MTGRSLMRNAMFSARRQAGAALVMALVILLVLTLLGVSAMRTSSLEQIMSGNVQDMMRAFEAAESGSTRALVSLSTFNTMTAPITASYNVTGSADVLKSSAVIFPPVRLQITDCPRGGKASGQGTKKCAHYEQVIVGATGVTIDGTASIGAQSVRDQGVMTDAPGNGGVTVTQGDK